MRIKDSTVNLQNLKPQMVLALIIIDQVMQKHGGEAVVTSVNDAYHGETSLHYDGGALDIRSRTFDNKRNILHEIKEALGFNPDFDAILEAEDEDWEHFHIEWQPKRRDYHR